MKFIYVVYEVESNPYEKVVDKYPLKAFNNSAACMVYLDSMQEQNPIKEYDFDLIEYVEVGNEKIEVSCCSDCPFYHFYTDFELGEFAECSLEDKPLTNDEVLIDLCPDWCPLLKEDYQITHKKADSENS